MERKDGAATDASCVGAGVLNRNLAALYFWISNNLTKMLRKEHSATNESKEAVLKNKTGPLR